MFASWPCFSVSCFNKVFENIAGYALYKSQFPSELGLVLAIDCHFIPSLLICSSSIIPHLITVNKCLLDLHLNQKFFFTAI